MVGALAKVHRFLPGKFQLPSSWAPFAPSFRIPLRASKSFVVVDHLTTNAGRLFHVGRVLVTEEECLPAMNVNRLLDVGGLLRATSG